MNRCFSLRRSGVSLAAICWLSLWTEPFSAAEPQPENEAKSSLAEAKLPSADLDVRFAMATLRVAEAELQHANEAIRKTPGAISQSEVRRLALAVELARLEVEKAKHPSGDVDVRMAEAKARMAEAELQRALEINRKAPGAILKSEVERLEHKLELARLQVEKAQAEQNVIPDRPREATDAEAAIRKALNEKTTFEFVELPLIDVVEKLSEEHEIPIQVDIKSLDDLGVGTDVPITRNLKNVSLRAALNLLLRDLDLTYLVTNEVLLITSKDTANSRLSTVVYDVRDLLERDRRERSQRGEDSSGFDYDSLIETITGTLGPTTWDEVGGPASIAPLYGTLVVSQTDQMHEEIREFLKDLREALGTPANGAVRRPAEQVKPIEAPERADPGALLLRIYPIASFVRWGAGGFLPPRGDRTRTHNRVLGQFGGAVSAKSDDQPVPTKTALPLSDAKIDAEQISELADLVKSIIEPQSWEARGGQGVIRGVPTLGAGPAALVVLQTQAVHTRIERLLSDLRAKEILGEPSKGVGFF